MDVVEVSAVVIRDSRGRVLTVRKRGTSSLMLPGGKPEPDETEGQTAVRECAEELAVAVDEARLDLIGRFSAKAANEDRTEVRATVFEHPFLPVLGPGAEIEHVEWVHPGEKAHSDLAPLLADEVFPALR